MAKIDWERRIGRRLKLRDLHVFFAVTQAGSMTKAAALLNVRQPTISAAIANIEHVFGAKLVDRSSQGVSPTVFGEAVLRRGLAAFDELIQSGRDIEFLSDPAQGEIYIGYQESLSPAFLAPLVRSFLRRHPSTILHMDDLYSAPLQLSELRARRYDLMLALLTRSLKEEHDLSVEVLFNDCLALAAGKHSSAAKRRKIDLAQLADEPWLLTQVGTWNYNRVFEAFESRGLPMPKANLITLSEPLRSYVLAEGKHITAFARSALKANAKRFEMKMLPVKLDDPPWPVVLITLKQRTLSPVVDRFIEYVRKIAGSLREQSG